MKTTRRLLSAPATSTCLKALAALTLALAPACSSGATQEPDEAAQGGGEHAPGDATGGATGGDEHDPSGATGGSAVASHSSKGEPSGSAIMSALGAPTGPDPYADPTCDGLTLDPWQRDAEGWTVLPATTQPGRRVIYVSAANAGKPTPDPGNPDVYRVATPEEGVALLRSGQPDSLLFARGETFHLAAAIDSHGLNGGASPADAKVVGAYGTGARPVIMWDQAHSIIAVESYAAQYLVVTQLDIEPDPSLSQQGTGMTLSSPSLSHVLVEDVKINGFQKGMDIESGTDVVVRRSQILSSCGGYRSQGIYTQDLTGFTLDENAMDQNGLQKCGDPTSGSPEGQGVYVQSMNACFRARGNVFARSLGNTLEARVGGDVAGNVFIGSSTALNYGLVLGGSIEGKTMPMGVYGRVTNNVFLDNETGVQFGNTAMALFSGNVMSTPDPVAADIVVNSGGGIGIHGLTISDNSLSNAKYFVSFQSGLPGGPSIVKNDGVNSQVTICDGAFGKQDGYTDGVLVFKYLSTSGSCVVGLEMNGGDVYSDATPSKKLIDSAATGILMAPTDPPVTFTAPNLLTGNSISWTKAPFEEGTTPLTTDPATYVPEKSDDLSAKFADPGASIADVLGSEAAFYTALAAQSRDAWNAKITAAALVPYFQKALAPVK